MEAARAALHEIIGEVLVVAKGPNVFAYSKLNENIGYKSGAEKRT